MKSSPEVIDGFECKECHVSCIWNTTTSCSRP